MQYNQLRAMLFTLNMNLLLCVNGMLTQFAIATDCTYTYVRNVLS
jgi:hypothetical protein